MLICACALVCFVSAGERVTHLFSLPDFSKGTRGLHYILMASALISFMHLQVCRNKMKLFHPFSLCSFFSFFLLLMKHLYIMPLRYNGLQMKRCRRHLAGILMAVLSVPQNNSVKMLKYKRRH